MKDKAKDGAAVKGGRLDNTITVSDRYCGPPDCANGGYVSGCLATYVGGDSVRIKLKAPTPLNTPLTVQREGDTWRLLAGEGLVAEAWAHDLQIEVPDIASLESVQQAHQQCHGFVDHAFPGCFVCGPERLNDGLGIFPGPVKNDQGFDSVASFWQPKDECYDPSGQLMTPFVWAALDCPTAFAALEYAENQALVPMVLGMLTVRRLKPITRQEGLIVHAWAQPGQGRKVAGYSAISSLQGECLAYAEAMWISIKK
ncbi:MAG: hypothetical protein COB04_14740 [Gammaproteobacteria bacterium]|nr:MAG: hypothetical protein COB04_14740 [Gammaproteobacteria bacterium]